MVSEVLVSTTSISDHSPIFCTWSFKLPKRLSQGHTYIEHRSFKIFNVESFLSDLSPMTFHSIFNYNDPSEAFPFWHDAFLPVVNKLASLRPHHHHQFLNREGRWGTTDDFATSFLHFSLFSTALWDLPNSRPVHSLMLSSHLFLCPPCLLPLSLCLARWFWPDLMKGRHVHTTSVCASL